MTVRFAILALLLPLGGVVAGATEVAGEPCPRLCPGDLDGDERIDAADLLAALIAWGPCPPGPECGTDLNRDGTVDFADAPIVLSGWGPCPRRSALFGGGQVAAGGRDVRDGDGRSRRRR